MKRPGGRWNKAGLWPAACAIILAYIISIPCPAVGEAVPLLVAAGKSIKNDLSPELISMPAAYSSAFSYSPLRRMPDIEEKKALYQFYAVDPALQAWHGAAFMPPPIENFEGLSNNDNLVLTGFRALPPDPNGDVGLHHYVQMVNSSFAVFDKKGNRLYVGAGNSLWTGFGGPCEAFRNTDPVVLYDRYADRWLMSILVFSDSDTPPGYECIAISQTGDPLGAWYRYAFKISDTRIIDYPKFGVWPDAFYMSGNQFAGDDFQGAGVVAFERDKMLQGLEAGFIYFDLDPVDPNLFGMLPSHLEGPVMPPPGAPNCFVNFDDNGAGFNIDRLRIWEFHADWNVTSNSTFIEKTPLLTASFDSSMCFYQTDCIPQPETTARLDAISDRLMYRLQYRNFGPYQTMVLNHTVDTDGSDRAGIRWYELRNAGQGWFIHQESTYAPDGDHRWMGSIAMDGNGNMALGYSVSGDGTYPSVRYTGRTLTDPLNTLPRAETTLIAGGGSQTHERSRWGDYSTMSVDPSDDLTFWYTQEYYDSTSALSWKTRIGSFTFKTYGITASAGQGGSISPSGTVSVNYGSSTVFTIAPDHGYHVADVRVDGVSIGPVTTYTFTNIESDHAIDAAFVLTTDKCAATLSYAFELHVPVIRFGERYLTGDAVCASDAAGAITCMATNYEEVSGAEFGNCETGLLTEDLQLHLPLILYLDFSIGADLMHMPSTDGQLWFSVTDYGLN
jgi:hypothetical protein